MITKEDKKYLKRAIELAERALEEGSSPFGSVLVSQDGHILFEDHNRNAGGDNTQHPEFSIARWAAANLSPKERKASTVYTSGEHCAMCSAAHGLVGLGRIVYASSSKQMAQWKKQELGGGATLISSIPIEEVIVDARVEGPVEEFSQEILELHRRYLKSQKNK